MQCKRFLPMRMSEGNNCYYSISYEVIAGGNTALFYCDAKEAPGSRDRDSLKRMLGPGILRRPDMHATLIPRHYLDSLEAFAAALGTPVRRRECAELVHGAAHRRHILLRRGLSQRQQFTALVHELTHVLAHRSPRHRVPRTLCEYEAEAVERLVASWLFVFHRRKTQAAAAATNHLLSASVLRVRRVAWTLIRAIELYRRSPPSKSMQRPVKKSFSTMNSAACAISAGSPRRLSGTGATTFSKTSGFMLARISVCVKPGAMAPTRMA